MLSIRLTVASAITLALLLSVIDCKPLREAPPQEVPVEGEPDDEGVETKLSYDRYLKEIVMALEEDPEFRKKLEETNASDIKDGSVARHIDLVGHQVRTKLDEIKRREIYRLQELRRVQMRSMHGTKVLHYIAYHGGVGNIEMPAHLDVRNPHSFEMKDLESLIKQTTNDLESLDVQRKKEFKEYEMEKEYEHEEKLKHMEGEQKTKEQKHFDELKTKHKEHPKLHHPGSKDQFEEVWDKKDHLEDQEFNPKAFFKLHDLGGDGFWGIEEVEAVLQSELDKVYDGRNEEDDPAERFEEMNRMREHIFTEMDKNRDSMISEEEFLSFTGPRGDKDEFKKDPGWKTIDEEPTVYSDDEYQEFLRQHHAQPGLVDVPPHIDPSVAHMQMQQGQIPQGQMPPGQGQMHQGQIPQHDNNLKFDPQQGQGQGHQQQQQQQHLQQQQYVQHQQMLEHQQQQLSQQHASQQQFAQQHQQMQQQQQQQQMQHQQQIPEHHQQIPEHHQQQMGQQGQHPGQGQPGQGQGQPPVQAQHPDQAPHAQAQLHAEVQQAQAQHAQAQVQHAQDQAQQAHAQQQVADQHAGQPPVDHPKV